MCVYGGGGLGTSRVSVGRATPPLGRGGGEEHCQGDGVHVAVNDLAHLRLPKAPLVVFRVTAHIDLTTEGEREGGEGRREGGRVRGREEREKGGRVRGRYTVCLR